WPVREARPRGELTRRGADVDLRTAEVGGKPAERLRRVDLAQKDRQRENRIETGGGLQHEERNGWPPCAPREEAAGRRAGPEIQQINGEDAAECARGCLQHHAEQAEPYHLQREREKPRAR